jgi:5'-3' exoribonuclease 2
MSAPNPNGVEYDNLYIDMNGLIHPCSHPEDRDAPATEAEMYVNITKYIDRLFSAVRPRRLLFLAIDGVAPRAKMNQQRSRRFRAAQDAKERRMMLQEVMEEMKSLGMPPPSEKAGHSWDSNVITPGTEFMHRLSAYIWFYVLEKMNTIPAWMDIKVIFSDASVPVISCALIFIPRYLFINPPTYFLLTFIGRRRAQNNEFHTK